MKNISKEELNAAIDRMKPGGDGVMRWLLEFSQKDLSKISEGDWMNLRVEFIIFQLAGGAKPLFDDRLPDLFKPEMKMFLRSANDIESWQEVLRGYIDLIIKKSHFTLPIPQMSISFVPPTLYYSKDDSWFSLTLALDLDSLTTCNFALAALLKKYTHLIRCCPECNKFFLADRKNQSFCSAKHQGYAAVRKYRKSKGLITGRKRGRPRKQETPEKKGDS